MVNLTVGDRNVRQKYKEGGMNNLSVLGIDDPNCMNVAMDVDPSWEEVLRKCLQEGWDFERIAKAFYECLDIGPRTLEKKIVSFEDDFLAMPIIKGYFQRFASIETNSRSEATVKTLMKLDDENDFAPFRNKGPFYQALSQFLLDHLKDAEILNQGLKEPIYLPNELEISIPGPVWLLKKGEKMIFSAFAEKSPDAIEIKAKIVSEKNPPIIFTYNYL